MHTDIIKMYHSKRARENINVDYFHRYCCVIDQSDCKHSVRLVNSQTLTVVLLRVWQRIRIASSHKVFLHQNKRV